MNLIDFINLRIDSLLAAMIAHIWLVFFSMTFAIIIAVTSGIFITLPPWNKNIKTRNTVFLLLAFGGCLTLFFKELSVSTYILTTLLWLYLLGVVIYRNLIGSVILYIDSIIMTIPSIALFGLLIPVLGIGFNNAIVVLIMYAQLPIIRNTFAGIMDIEPQIVDAAKGMGMSNWQLILRVKFPIALPVIMAGIRTAIIMIVGIAAIASYIGAKSLGEFIFRGISRGSTNMILTGSICVAFFAVITDILFGGLEKWLTPKGLRKSKSIC